MITFVYIAIVAYVLGMVLWNLYTEDHWGDQVIAVFVMIPLLLRLLGVK